MEVDQLERVEKLLALNLIQDKQDKEAVLLLYRADYNSAEIGEFLGISASTVRNKISKLRNEGKIND
ncbi:sigma factor-like helix-turn-helix DNA-binding protein [Halosimplex marinum]|uniref:sigma factor-like helix-turn-helix DNA-binding protein n=1 Tax=Halosimplex marinum TaxID=3396620 RepID=UPI003F554352